MSIRMQDVANRLGLSLSTVSLALRASPKVADETRVRVIEEASRVGYTVRLRHQQPALSQVSFITRDDLGNDFYNAVLSGAESECRRLGITLHYTQIDQRVPTPFHFGVAEGLLVVGSISEAIVLQIKLLGLPTVLVDNNLSFFDIDRVLIDNIPAMHRTTTYAYNCGHRSIAFLCGPLEIISFRERLLGYRAAMQNLGLAPIELFFHDIDARDVEQVLHTWQQNHKGFEFTALIGCNDKTIVRAFHTLRDCGFHVPNDISLLGFDDVELASAIRPALTTNRVPRELLGRLGVQRLVDRARDPDHPPLALLVETTLIERDSVQVRT